MNNGQSPTKEIWERVKFILALAPAAMIFGTITAVLIEMFDWDFNINFWLLLAIWVFLLWFFVKDGVGGEKDWDRVKMLWICIGYGFMGTAISLVILGVLLQWTLNIDIQEFDRSIYLSFIVWIGWMIGVHFYFKNQEKTQIQEHVESQQRMTKNKDNKSDPWELPSTLEDFQAEVEHQHPLTENSSISKKNQAERPILYPKEIQKLLKMRKVFAKKSELEKAQHKHLWSPAIIPPSAHTYNHRKTEVCYQCGQIGEKYDTK